MVWTDTHAVSRHAGGRQRGPRHRLHHGRRRAVGLTPEPGRAQEAAGPARACVPLAYAGENRRVG